MSLKEKGACCQYSEYSGKLPLPSDVPLRSGNSSEEGQQSVEGRSRNRLLSVCGRAQSSTLIAPSMFSQP